MNTPTLNIKTPIDLLESEIVTLHAHLCAEEYQFLVKLREFDLRQGWARLPLQSLRRVAEHEVRYLAQHRAGKTACSQGPVLPAPDLRRLPERGTVLLQGTGNDPGGDGNHGTGIARLRSQGHRLPGGPALRRAAQCTAEVLYPIRQPRS